MSKRPDKRPSTQTRGGGKTTDRTGRESRIKYRQRIFNGNIWES